MEYTFEADFTQCLTLVYMSSAVACQVATILLLANAWATDLIEALCLFRYCWHLLQWSQNWIPILKDCTASLTDGARHWTQVLSHPNPIYLALTLMHRSFFLELVDTSSWHRPLSSLSRQRWQGAGSIWFQSPQAAQQFPVVPFLALVRRRLHQRHWSFMT